MFQDLSIQLVTTPEPRFKPSGKTGLLGYCTAMVAVLLVTLPSADLTTIGTLLPVGAFCGILIFTWKTPGKPGACPAKIHFGHDTADEHHRFRRWRCKCRQATGMCRFRPKPPVVIAPKPLT